MTVQNPIESNGTWFRDGIHTHVDAEYMWILWQNLCENPLHAQGLTSKPQLQIYRLFTLPFISHQVYSAFLMIRKK